MRWTVHLLSVLGIRMASPCHLRQMYEPRCSIQLWSRFSLERCPALPQAGRVVCCPEPPFQTGAGSVRWLSAIRHSEKPAQHTSGLWIISTPFTFENGGEERTAALIAPIAAPSRRGILICNVPLFWFILYSFLHFLEENSFWPIF